MDNALPVVVLYSRYYLPEFASALFLYYIAMVLQIIKHVFLANIETKKNVSVESIIWNNIITLVAFMLWSLQKSLWQLE